MNGDPASWCLVSPRRQTQSFSQSPDDPGPLFSFREELVLPFGLKASNSAASTRPFVAMNRCVAQFATQGQRIRIKVAVNDDSRLHLTYLAPYSNLRRTN